MATATVSDVSLAQATTKIKDLDLGGSGDGLNNHDSIEDSLSPASNGLNSSGNEAGSRSSQSLGSTGKSSSSTASAGLDDVTPIESELQEIDGSQPLHDGHDEVGPSANKHSPTDTDAGPFNVAGYQRRLQPNNVVHETFSEPLSDEYDLSRGQRVAIIFNQREFNPSLDLPKRNGTDKDCEAISITFKALGFKVTQHDNLTVNELRSVMFEIQTIPNISCLALFILTHGEQNGLLYGKDTSYRLNKEIIGELLPNQCPNLAGKPKLIFIQACQGSEVDGGTRVKSGPSFPRSRHTSTDGDAPGLSYCIPNYADFLIFQAAYHGYYSFRSASGSWFIQSLCQELEACDVNEELSVVLTRVSRSVAITRHSNVPTDPILHNKKQIPLRQETLLRRIYLKRGLQPVTSPSAARTVAATRTSGRSGQEARSSSSSATPKATSESEKLKKCKVM